VHLLAAVLIPFGPEHSSIKPLAARDAAVWTRLDTLLFRYMQPDDEWAWGVDEARGFRFDWWALGGRYDGWGREVRSRITPLPSIFSRNSARLGSGRQPEAIPDCQPFVGRRFTSPTASRSAAT
jgi:hypothetical protein